MKTIVFAATAVLVTAAAQAGTITFTEVYSDHYLTSGSNTESTLVTQADKAQFTAILKVPGLAALDSDTNAQFGVDIGAWSWSAGFGDATKHSSNSVTFIQKEGTNKPTGFITFTKREETLIVAGASSAISPSIVAEGLKGTRGKTNGQLDIKISVGDLTNDATLFYSADSQVVTRKSASKTNVFDTVGVMGTTDTVAPIVALLPAPGKHTAGESLVVTAKAWDNIEVASVWISISSTNTADYVEAVKVARGYQATVALVAGVNTIRAVAIDAAGNKSKPAVLRVTAKAK